MMENNTPENEAFAARRRALAQALRSGEPVSVTPTGEIARSEEVQDSSMSAIQVPEGKLA